MSEEKDSASFEDFTGKRPRPAVNSLGQKELDKAAEQIDQFTAQVKGIELDRSRNLPREEQEPQTKLSSDDIRKSKDIYLKPKRSVSTREPFNERYREEYNFAKEYVYFIAEHKEIIGESIEIWTKPFAGMPAEEWAVPVNTPVHGPRYLAEQIKRKFYHRLTMDKSIKTGSDGAGQYYGSMVADTTIQRLDAMPVSTRKSIFMGAASL